MAVQRTRSSILPQTISLVVFFLLWQVASVLVNGDVLPQPFSVLQMMWSELMHGELLFHVSMTLGRVLAAFTLSMAIGTALGLFMGRNKQADDILDVWLIIFLNMPALVIIILAYVWFGLIEAAAIGAVALNKIPNVAVTLREGARALDPELFEIAQAYRWSRGKVFQHVILPQLWPYILGAARSGLALIWKIVLVVELLGRSSGVGFQLHLYFQLFDVTGILAYASAFILVVQMIEYSVFKPLERRLFVWRD